MITALFYLLIILAVTAVGLGCFKKVRNYFLTVDLHALIFLERFKIYLWKKYESLYWKRNADVGSEELGYLEEVSSLKKEKEVLKYRKEKLEREIDRREKVAERYRTEIKEASLMISELDRKLPRD